MVENVSDQEADAYFASRHRGSRLGACASQQSRPLENRQALKDAVAALEERFDGKEDIDRPPYWSGYRVIPQRMEFWHDGEYRLHTRMMYTKDDSGNWSREMLYP